VLRFSNHDVMTNRQGAVEAIDAALAASPSLPSPASGGGGEAGASGAVDTAHAASPSPPSPTCGGGRPDSELGS
jgi:hypothetical protein